jgi:hypothetical protein
MKRIEMKKCLFKLPEWILNAPVRTLCHSERCICLAFGYF